MYLSDLAKIIYIPGTASMSTKITVRVHHEPGTQPDERILWEGPAEQLQCWNDIDRWAVVEVLIDKNDKFNTMYYNKAKVITVI